MLTVSLQTQYLDLVALSEAPLVESPFPFVLLPSLIKAEAFERVCKDCPKIVNHGSFPLSSLSYGPAFAALCQELQDPFVRDVFQDKLGIDLSGRPATITVRGQTVQKDGAIHIDSRTKLVTVLIYLNDQWSSDGGRLRLLRSAKNIEDVVAEVPPSRGACVAFVNTKNAWHGHKPFVGPRRSIQLNWVTDEAVARNVDRRHAWSARVKKISSSLFGRHGSEMTNN